MKRLKLVIGHPPLSVGIYHLKVKLTFVPDTL